MAKEFSELLREVAGKSFEEKAAAARIVRGQCLEILEKIGVKGESADAVTLAFLAAAISADRRFSVAEQKMTNAVFGGDVTGRILHIDPDTVTLMDSLVDAMPEEDKHTFCLLAIYVVAVDDAVNSAELTYLNRLLA